MSGEAVKLRQYLQSLGYGTRREVEALIAEGRVTGADGEALYVDDATLAEDLRGNEATLFAAGTLMLEGEHKPLLPAEFEVLGPREARLTLHEGRYHQVRRMFAATGNAVATLHREAIGGLALDALGLAEGEWRMLDAAERAVLGS